ncbi:hypothetical protein EDC04DRAFT_2663840 [Pisolithus marmoratus]|nr:hypothetical protein EDC04DRAFT_2663840 [Pisolithus marmoratus]
MQPSQLEIQREVEALRDIRRRSTAQGGPGALILDPDLPSPSSPTSPTSTYWSAAATQHLADGDSSSGSHEDSGSSEERLVASDDPSHLFWVPARLHPEIAPAENTPARLHPEGSTTVGRSNSLGNASSGLERRRSMLSRQYKPSENDGVEEETIVPIQRRRSSLMHPGPQLTISDLQRLEELAEEASKTDDPSRFRAAIRRSLSLNVAPSAFDKIDNIADIPDEADAPIIIPPRGQILRRAARTKIRKAGQPGEGAPHRFGPGRRNRATSAMEQRTSSDLSSNDHTSYDIGDGSEQLMRPRAFSAENIIANDVQASKRPDSFTEEASIYDSYVREDDLTQFASSIVSPPPPLSLSLSAEDQELHAPSEIQEVPIQPPVSLPTPVPELQHPQPQRLPAATSVDEITRKSSPDTATLVPSTEETLVTTPSADSFSSTKSSSTVPKKEKDKKGLFGKWGSDKSAKKSKDREREKDSQREKESGFFGSLFGKRKQDEGHAGPGYSGAGREAAAALLGTAKTKSSAPSPSPQPGPMGYARYPIHVERAIYRLSHIKLANPRRPLYEQVLISNLMFWYLGVINKTQNPASTQGPQTQSAAMPAQSSPETEHVDQERCEAEERQRAERERLEKERQEQERAKEVQPQPQKKDSRRGALTKAAPGQPGGRRTAEMPVKGPQYEMQHRVMEQEYNAPGYTYGASGSGGARVHRQPSPPIHSPPMEPDPSGYAYTGYGYSDGDIQYMPQGGVQPMALDPSWSPVNPGSPPMPNSPSSQLPQNGPVHPETVVTPSPQQRSRSPPSQNHNRYAPIATAPGRPQVAKGSGRSLSATAITSQSLSPDLRPRKAASARVVPSAMNGQPPAGIGTSQEEDVPLAVWQQQRRR